LLHNVQRWMAHRIVSGEVPENNHKNFFFQIDKFSLKLFPQSIKAYMAG
jgi:hypothetical protein